VLFSGYSGVLTNKSDRHDIAEIFLRVVLNIYDVGNPGYGLGQAHKYGQIKPVNEIPISLPLDNWISNSYTYKTKR
jgi:hypothetical protein